VQSFELKFSGVTVLQAIFLLILGLTTELMRCISTGCDIESYRFFDRGLNGHAQAKLNIPIGHPLDNINVDRQYHFDLPPPEVRKSQMQLSQFVSRSPVDGRGISVKTRSWS